MTTSILENIWQLDATALVAAYGENRLTPTQAIDVSLDRIARLDGMLNAFCCLSPSARADAADSTERWQNHAPIGPLDGVPVALKDNLAVAGMPASFGSRLFSDSILQQDELPVARLRAAGAIIVGKTTTPEFAVEGYTASDLHGVTRNPWNLGLTPGGSSGGSVAAVAAGLVPIALGTDGGGSTRRPAAYTGLVGLKPGIGHVPRDDGLPQILLDFEVIGSFSRSVRDVSRLDAALSEPDRRDPTSCGLAPSEISCRPLRILFAERIGENPCDGKILEAVEASAETFRSMGHEVLRTGLPFDVSGLAEVWSSIAEIGLARLCETHPDFAAKANPKYVAMADRGAGRSAADLLAILDIVRRLRRDVARAFADVDLILMPACAAMPWAAQNPFPEVIDGEHVGPRGHAVYTGWVNASGHPAIVLPCKVARGALPIGFQLIGDRGSEASLLHVAARYEDKSPWQDRWPDIASG